MTFKMAEQESRAEILKKLAVAVEVDVSEGVKSLRQLQREIRKTIQLAKELENTLKNQQCHMVHNVTVNQ